MRIAFLTSAELADLTADDELAIPHLEARGCRVEPAVWTDERVDWAAFDLVVVRSTWDWHADTRRFRSVLDAIPSLENRGASRWLDKRYLADLGARGVGVIPAEVVRARAELDEKLANYKEPVVLKPATAAGARLTERVEFGDAARAHAALDAILARDDVALLQPFVTEVATEGEWSLVFLDGAFSHALKKRPARGDFRVQEDFGGSVEPAAPPREVLEAATRAVRAAGEPFLYARVDGIEVPRFGGFCVTELEVVEPELFLRVDPAAPARFADAIVKRVLSS